MSKDALFTSKRPDWRTPRALFEQIDKEVGGFTLDVASSHDNALCKAHYTKEENGLVQPWAPHVCWCNPPYGRGVGRWMEKAWLESREGATVVVLVPARTDTQWFHGHVLGKATEIRFLKGRLRFDDGPHPAPFPSMLAFYRPVAVTPLLRSMRPGKDPKSWVLI